MDNGNSNGDDDGVIMVIMLMVITMYRIMDELRGVLNAHAVQYYHVEVIIMTWRSLL